MSRTCSSSRLTTGRTVGKRHRRIRAQSATGQVAGAATEQSPGSEPIVQTGLPTMRSPESPRPGRQTIRSRPDASFRDDFHVPRRARLVHSGARNASADTPAFTGERHSRRWHARRVAEGASQGNTHRWAVLFLIRLMSERPGERMAPARPQVFGAGPAASSHELQAFRSAHMAPRVTPSPAPRRPARLAWPPSPGRLPAPRREAARTPPPSCPRS